MDKQAIQDELRPTLYRRLHWMWPVLAHPLVRGLGWLVFALWLGFAILTSVLRFVVLPNVSQYQPEIERLASEALGQTVRIGRIETRWSGLNPDLVLNEFQIHDRQGQPALTLNQVDAVLSWTSLWRGRLVLSLLAIESPVLHIRRELTGKLSVAGIETDDSESDPAALRWVLEQSHIRIRNATLVWEDRLRGAPPLVLEDLQFGLDNRGRHHRFGLSALPPDALAARIDLRAEIDGDPGDALNHLEGKFFAQFDYADLGGWQPWIDYPVQMPQGRGALRLWGGQEEGVAQLTADVALEEVNLRLADDLPLLDLATLRGRLQGRYAADAWLVSGRKVELLTRDGVRVTPTDFEANWRRQPKAGEITGNASATSLNLGALVRLAGHFPLDPLTRQRLERHQPVGRVDELRASWRLAGEQLTQYSLKADFRELGLRAEGPVPGARGLSGHLEASEQGGLLVLDSAGSGLSLPAVFPYLDIALDRLQGRAKWKIDPAGKLEVSLDSLDFAGPDATATASGTYRHLGDGPGVIDLSASISRADGTAVWRYMPHAVNAAARHWLQRGIVTGHATDGKFVLKGDLRDFPFRDPAKGSFFVTAKAHDVKIDYAQGWPVITQVDGEMRFDKGMRVVTDRGQILGANLGKVVVEIPDFDDGPITRLKVQGEASGPTAEFLKFIEQSPVTEKIDRFTEGMQAGGSGRLDLGLEIPLEKVENSKVRGEYRFIDNQVQVVSGLPPVSQLNGHLKLTERSVQADDISGRLFGGAMKLRVRNEGDKVAVLATGNATAAALREHFAWPGMAQLGGSANWRTEINIRKRNADFRVDSDLVGITSALPDQFNKTAMTPLPLRLERSAVDPKREQWKVTLGKLARGQIVLRDEAGKGVLDKGAFVTGEGELRLPEKGLLVQVSQPSVDGDAWRRAFSAEGSGATNGESAGVATTIQLRTPNLRLMGRDYHNVDVSLRPREGGWQIGLNMREALGELVWRSAGDGFLEGRLKRLVIKPSPEGADSEQPSLIDSLPGMNLTVDELTVGEKALGQFEVRARNAGTQWQLENLSLRNPDGQLKGKGSWQKAGGHRTQLDFELASGNVGKLVERLGYGDVVRRGKANLNGNLTWQGPLVAIDYPTLSGRLDVNAEKGQFNKLEPGVGKLLGLISMQSLPRRLTLDFRDIFSDGLAFDSIEGKLNVARGIMRTSEPLAIKGPAAQIRIEGETDLKNETQDLTVEVRPELSTAAAVGAALVNPVAGAAALVVSSVLPINRLFSYRYRVTGTWNDPQVDKVGVTAPEAATREGASVDSPVKTEEGKQ